MGLHYILTNITAGDFVWMQMLSPRASLYANQGPKMEAEAVGETALASDIGFLVWQADYSARYGTTQLRPPPRIRVPRAQNKYTMAIMKRIFGNTESKSMPEWPGMTFYRGEENFTAVLGTPNVWPTAYMLAQHQQEFGGKWIIRAIQVWRHRNGYGSSTDENTRIPQDLSFEANLEIHIGPMEQAQSPSSSSR